MSTWTEDQLQRIAASEELTIAPVRATGQLRRPTPIWAVRVDDDVYVRAAYTDGSAWHRVARASGRAHITAGGAQADVEVQDADSAVLDAVDTAYRAKYGDRYAGIVGKIVDAEHRATTLRLTPRSAR